MTQEEKKLINLSVNESVNPSIFSANSESQATGETGDLNDSVHDDENVDVPHPKPLETENDGNIVNSQVTIANLSAG
jgi:hypothetical protein